MSDFHEKIICKSDDVKKVDFLNGAVFLIDKPLAWTSFDVVNKLRFKLKHTLKIKKIKVGHAGTLDPLASGLLIICTGKLTKEIDKIQAYYKLYSGTIKLGATTPTYDSEVAPDYFYETKHIDQNLIFETKNKFIGKLDQVPPIFSAIKIDGQKAYNIARRGNDVEMKSRPIEIYSFDILDWTNSEISFVVKCSKGTYIRSLAHDFGKALNSGGYLLSLRREAIGDFQVKEALSVDEACDFIEKNIF